MRRSALKLAALAGLSLASLPAFASKAHPFDKRLLGTWRSDKERTVKLWRYKQELTEEQKAKFESIFGKLTRRFTSTHAYSEFEDQKIVGRYWVVASDSRSVVVKISDEGRIDLQQIFFEENSIYVFSGYNVEFFRRVEA
jgi:hypothetical protein